MSSDPILDPSLSVIPPEPTDPFQGLPASNPERAVALLTSAQSLISSALRDFGAGGSAGFAVAAIAPMAPLLVEQATAALRDLEGEVIDAALLNLAQMLVAARSTDAATAAVITTWERADEDFDVVERPPHNED